jgi:hypothetical protein
MDRDMMTDIISADFSRLILTFLRNCTAIQLVLGAERPNQSSRQVYVILQGGYFLLFPAK